MRLSTDFIQKATRAEWIYLDGSGSTLSFWSSINGKELHKYLLRWFDIKTRWVEPYTPNAVHLTCLSSDFLGAPGGGTPTLQTLSKQSVHQILWVTDRRDEDASSFYNLTLITFDECFETKTKKEPTMPQSQNNIRIETTKSFAMNDVAGVELVLTGDHGTSITVEGSAKRNPTDKPDPSIGLDLAYGRALRKIARVFEKTANEKVLNAEKEERKAKHAADVAKGEKRRANREKNLARENKALRAQLTKAREIVTALETALPADEW